MKWLGRLLACVLLGLILPADLSAQEVSAAEYEGNASSISPAPQGHVLDQADLFREHPVELEALQMKLHRLEKDYAFPVYIAVYYNIYVGNLQQRADELYQAWIGDSKRGMVIVYQLDPLITGNNKLEQLPYGGNPAISYYKGSELNEDIDKAPAMPIIPGRDLEAMLARAYKSIGNDKDDHMAYLEHWVDRIQAEIEAYHQVPPAKWSDDANLKLMFVFLGIIIGCTVLGMLLWRLFARADAKSNKIYYFPDVQVSRRLGAPYGGGWVSEKTFVPSSSRE